MPDVSPRLALPFIAPSQAQKHVTHNEALRLLDGITQLAVMNFGAESPPGVPGEGDLYALGAAPTGLWAGQADKLAMWSDTAWIFFAPGDGWRAWGDTEQALRVFTGGAWVDVAADLQNVDGIGVNTTSDPVNRLAVAADASLFSHDGTGHQMKVNKATIADTASLVFQSNWIGHAEMGLTGDNNFHIKVTSDGASWTEALVLNQSTGYVTGNAVQSGATDITVGRLALAQHAYSPGNLVGSVSQSGGTPTGSVIESGSNANGEFTRFADGTLICAHEIDDTAAAWSDASGSLFKRATSITWTYPSSFIAAPSISGTIKSSGVSGVSVTSKNTTNGKFRPWSSVSKAAASNKQLYTLAIGRWF